MVRYKCPQCGVRLESPSSMTGQEDTCPACGATSVVPQAAANRTPLIVAMVCGAVALSIAVVVGAWLWRRAQDTRPTPRADPSRAARTPQGGRSDTAGQVEPPTLGTRPAPRVPTRRARPLPPGVRLVVGVRECSVYATAKLGRRIGVLNVGERVSASDGDESAVPVWTARGPSGWVRRCCLCSADELRRRQADGEVPRRVVCVRWDGSRASVHGDRAGIVHGQLGLLPGDAFWADPTMKGRTFRVAAIENTADPAKLVLYKGHGDRALLAIADAVSGPGLAKTPPPTPPSRPSPTRSEIAAEKLKQALCALSAGKRDQAKELLESVASAYGDTSSGRRAKRMVASLWPSRPPGRPRTPSPPLGPPPRWPSLAGVSGWSKSDSQTLDEIRKQYAADPVSACLELKQILEREKKPPTAEQKRWLQGAMAAVKPRAQAVLSRDFRRACTAQDLRGAMIAWAVAEKVAEGLLNKAAIAALRKRLSSGTDPSVFHPVWRVGKVKGTYLSAAYSEGSAHGTGRFTLRPKPGYRLLRVTADVENVSDESDPPYTPWAFSAFKRLFMSFGGKKKASSQPARLAVDEFFYLVAAGKLIPCGHVCEGCSKLRGATLTISGKDGSGAMVFPGGKVAKGERFQADVLFCVPAATRDVRLLVLGAAPVPARIGS